jgi:hypothetical protein
LRFGTGARDEGDPVISLGAVHWIAGLILALMGAGFPRKVVYTTLAVLVEIGQPFSGMSPDRAMSLTAKPAMSGAC